MSSGVKFSASGTEKGSFVRKDLQRYATKLRELDRNGDGELDLEEICLAVDEMIQTRKENRLIKWFMGALAVVTLLTIAATVGLTAAVIILSKDTSVSNNTLVVKETGESLTTGATFIPQAHEDLYTATAEELSHIQTYVTRGPLDSDVEFIVHHVSKIEKLKNDAGIRIFTASNENITITPYQRNGAAALVPNNLNATTPVTIADPALLSGKRRLLYTDDYCPDEKAAFAALFTKGNACSKELVGSRIDPVETYRRLLEDAGSEIVECQGLEDTQDSVDECSFCSNALLSNDGLFDYLLPQYTRLLKGMGKLNTKGLTNCYNAAKALWDCGQQHYCIFPQFASVSIDTKRWDPSSPFFRY